MSNKYVYAGAADSGRVIRLGSPVFTQITSAGTAAVLAEWETWDEYPMGPNGEAIFRGFAVRFRCTDGYNIRVTPSVDGVALTAQDFSGSLDGQGYAEAWFTARGTYASCHVALNARQGYFELIDIQAIYVPLRPFQ